MPGFSLHKSEKVRSQKLIESLWKENSCLCACRIQNCLGSDRYYTSPLLRSICKSEKKLKLAHDRNKRKRLLRELYRLNKQDLLNYLQASNLHIAISLNYVGIEPLSFHLHQVGFQKALNKLILELQKNHSVSLPPAH